MRKAFTLIEVLISIFVLFLGLLGIAAVFARSTQTYVDNYEAIQAFNTRRSAEAFYTQIDRTTNPLVNGWNIEYYRSFHSTFRIAFLTFQSEVYPPIIVTACFKGQDAIYQTTFASYMPINKDLVVSWYGFYHKVSDDILQLQEFEKRQSILILPYRDMQILDIHRTDFLNFN